MVPSIWAQSSSSKVLYSCSLCHSLKPALTEACWKGSTSSPIGRLVSYLQELMCKSSPPLPLSLFGSHVHNYCPK